LKQRKSLFIFLQGHPEYDPESLLREYYRDVGRFLRGERDAYPQMPRDYFAAGAALALTAFRTHALERRHIDLLADFPSVEMTGRSRHIWRAPAVRIYENWLSLLAHGLTARARAV